MLYLSSARTILWYIKVRLHDTDCYKMKPPVKYLCSPALQIKKKERKDRFIFFLKNSFWSLVLSVKIKEKGTYCFVDRKERDGQVGFEVYFIFETSSVRPCRLYPAKDKKAKRRRVSLKERKNIFKKRRKNRLLKTSVTLPKRTSCPRRRATASDILNLIIWSGIWSRLVF